MYKRQGIPFNISVSNDLYLSCTRSSRVRSYSNLINIDESFPLITVCNRDKQLISLDVYKRQIGGNLVGKAGYLVYLIVVSGAAIENVDSQFGTVKTCLLYTSGCFVFFPAGAGEGFCHLGECRFRI